MRRIDLDEPEVATVRELLAQRIPDSEVRGFGSHADGALKRLSNLDSDIMSEHPLLDELHLDLADSDLPIRVDVVVLGDMAASLRRNIEERSAVLVRRLPDVSASLPATQIEMNPDRLAMIASLRNLWIESDRGKIRP